MIGTLAGEEGQILRMSVPAGSPPGGGGSRSSGPYRGRPGEVIDPTQVPVYRGGQSLQAKPGEVKVGKDGLVQPTHGVSLETDPSGLGRFGGANRVKSIPDELQIMQRGSRDVHFKVCRRSQ